MNNKLYDIKVTDINGHEKSLSEFKGKTLLIINVASKCGFTDQYKDLEEIYLKHRPQGLEILGFPCNQFGAQEPGTNSEIMEFCQLNYGVTFPIFSKIEVNGENTHPLFQYLKKSLPGILGSEAIKWNFTKFLVDKNGLPVKRFAPTDKPFDILKSIDF
jgi:glutathione peroxidase